MELTQIDQFAVGAALIAVSMCGSTLIRTQIVGLLLQAALLVGICIRLSSEEHSAFMLFLASAMIIIKVIGIPMLLQRTARHMEILRDSKANLHPSLSLLCGCGILILGYALAPQFAIPVMLHSIAAGMSVSMLFIGMFLMISRRLAISQVIGFLTMENGIALYSLTQTRSMPLLLEMSIVFEVLVGVLIAVLVIYRISRSFEHIDAAQMRGLRH